MKQLREHWGMTQGQITDRHTDALNVEKGRNQLTGAELLLDYAKAFAATPENVRLYRNGRMPLTEFLKASGTPPAVLRAGSAKFEISSGAVSFKVQRASILKVREKLLERFPRDAVNELIASSAFVDADERGELEMYLYFEERLLAMRSEQRGAPALGESVRDDGEQDPDEEAMAIDSKTDGSAEALEVEQEILAEERAKRAKLRKNKRPRPDSKVRKV